ncbi:hypothetical protein CROQUDRAFT_658126 [Cronartium quercuum f. sp. fusiforme G11]|uniref:cystathionine gamma-lyase n=1 Tax=Cronartium quercuum f. sp. fusiforme G11 TaxID=708437 RepID=A0A9P6NFE8_9BASI|nr:hypothetical protein CROQUDRAFT_658126 [Cronartium quercuum f. sp. fusiforme G11]
MHTNDASTTKQGSITSSNPYQDFIGTQLIHVGSHPDPSTGAVIPPISLSTTYKQDAIGVHKGFEYTRSLNPNRLALETLVAALEGAPELAPAEPGGLPLPLGLASSSGSSATATVIQALVPQGGHIISMSDVYGGTHRYLTRVAGAFGVQTTFLDLSATGTAETAQSTISALKSAIRPDGTTRLVWIESPTNPTLRLAPIAAIAKVAHAHGLILVVDNTFLSPIYQQPLSLGADIVIHSATKYLNGHSDVLLGMIVTRERSMADTLRFLQNAHGAVPSAFDSWLAQRGLKTLELRMARHGRNALLIARWLSKVAKDERKWILDVVYPGLGSQLAWEQLPLVTAENLKADGFSPENGFPYGGMVSFRLADGIKAERFLSGTRLFSLAESLGGVESLAELPARMTHAGIPEAHRVALGVDDGLIRLSVGIEDGRDLLLDLEQSLGRAVLGEEGWKKWKANQFQS